MRSVRSYKVNTSGFTLIELLVVIAILGILAVGLLFTIDPLDKINEANDATVIQTVTQLGRANDAYAVSHSDTYVGGSLSQAVTDLNGAGEIKYSTVNPPTGYTINYYTDPATCVSGACTDYVFSVNLQAKIHSGGFYVYADGKGCYMGSTTLISSSTRCP